MCGSEPVHPKQSAPRYRRRLPSCGFRSRRYPGRLAALSWTKGQLMSQADKLLTDLQKQGRLLPRQPDDVAAILPNLHEENRRDALRCTRGYDLEADPVRTQLTSKFGRRPPGRGTAGGRRRSASAAFWNSISTPNSIPARNPLHTDQAQPLSPLTRTVESIRKAPRSQGDGRRRQPNRLLAPVRQT